MFGVLSCCGVGPGLHSARDGSSVLAGQVVAFQMGAGDEKGAFNLITPENVMRALKVPKTGKIYRRGIPYSNTMPKFGSRTYALHIPGLPTGGVLGDNQIVWNDEFIVGELGQVGTQFDGPGHVGLMCKDGVMRWYNGAELASPANMYGN